MALKISETVKIGSDYYKVSTNGDLVKIITSISSDPIVAELKKKADINEYQPIYANNLPLPIGAATANNQTNNNQTTQLVNSSGDAATISERINTPTGKVLQVQIGQHDPIANVPVIIGFEHHQLHEGETYQAQDKQSTLGVTTIQYSIVIPSGVMPHFVTRIQVNDGTVEVDIYEDATYTGGSIINSFNKNRNSLNTPNSMCYVGVTSSDGILIESFYVGNGGRAAGNSRSDSEWVLKSNTIYRVDLIGITTGTDVIIQFYWYEDLGI